MGVVFINLKSEELESPAYGSLLGWAAGIPVDSGAGGMESLADVVIHNAGLESPFGAFVLYDDANRVAVGTVSVVPDDMDVGKETGIEGLWIADVNVREDCRGKGYGTMLFGKLDGYLSGLGRGHMRVNLFVSNPIALRIYERFGFRKTGIVVARHGEKNSVCSKHYNGRASRRVHLVGSR